MNIVNKNNRLTGAIKNGIDRIIKWIDTRVIAAVMAFIFIVSMLPSWYLAFFARPSGDDYGYSMGTHQAWLNTHSLREVFKAGIATTKNMCMSWNGDWFTVFLFTLMPEVFVPYSFWIVPITITLAVTISIVYFVHEVTVKRLGFAWYESLAIAAVILIVSYQFIPYTSIAMYWYVGVVHYMFPHVIALLLLSYLSKFERTGRLRYIVYSALGTIMIGGSSYFSFLLLFMIYAAVGILCFKKSKRISLLGIPFVTGMVALYFQITAPGNAARGGDDFGFSIGRMLDTIGASLVQGVVSIGDYIKNKTFIFVLFVVLAVFVWDCFLKAGVRYRFRLPGIFLIYMYCIYAAMFAPALYVSVDVSGGPATMQYMTFILAAVASIVYFEGWLANRIADRNEERFRKRVMVPVLCACGVFVILCRGLLSDSVFRRSCEYVVSGQANDFREQINSQMELLMDDSLKEVYLCPINNEQGPLMHMPVTSDPTAFTNWAVAGFYGKDKVIMEEAGQENER